MSAVRTQHMALEKVPGERQTVEHGILRRQNAGGSALPQEGRKAQQPLGKMLTRRGAHRATRARRYECEVIALACRGARYEIESEPQLGKAKQLPTNIVGRPIVALEPTEQIDARRI